MQNRGSSQSVESPESIIRDLAANLKPVSVKKLGPRVVMWLGIGVLFEVVALAVVGLREDLGAKLGDPRFVAALVGFVLGFVAASYFAWREGFPGRSRERPWVVGLSLGCALLAGIVCYATLLPEHHTAATSIGQDFMCCLRMVGGATLPNVILLVLASRLAPMRPGALVTYVLASSSFLVVIAGQLNCPLDDAAHVLVGHGLMVLSLNVATYLIYRFVLGRLETAAWRRRVESDK